MKKPNVTVIIIALGLLLILYLWTISNPRKTTNVTTEEYAGLGDTVIKGIISIFSKNTSQKKA